MSVRSLVCAAAIGLGLALASEAAAIPISGSSSGAFSGLSGCDTNGNDRECGIVGSSNGSKTQVRWPYLDDKKQINYASSLTAVDVTIDTSGGAEDVVIARLDWFNAATDASDTPDDFTVDWKLSISFTNPNVSIDTERFELSIFNTNNPTGDRITGFTLNDLRNLSFDLNGIIMGGFDYLVLDGAGNCYSTDAYITGTTWHNCEGNTSSLFITADFISAASNEQNPGAVNEPATIALLAAGLLALVAIRRRKTA